jgi:tellurite resistance-related uncharacterized protein
MLDNEPDSSNASQLRQKALARWDNEGGAGPDGPQKPHKASPEVQPIIAPYKSTQVFDENTLPTGLRREHRTKQGVWGVIRVLEGRLRYQVVDPASEAILDPSHPGLVSPGLPHLVEPLGPIKLQLEFFNQKPDLTGSGVTNI